MNNIKLSNILTKEIVNSYLNQIWRLITGPLTLFLIPLFITQEIQGFWYTFGSISALSIFADLGFTTIILQFSAHEYAYLSFNSCLEIEGPEKYRRRLASLFKFVIKWSATLIVIAFPAIFIIGYVLFSLKANTSVWLIPWIIYSCGSAIGFFSSVLASFIQGCGQVSKIQKIYFFTAIINTIVLIIALIIHLELLSISITIFISNICNLIFILYKYRKFLKSLLIEKDDNTRWRNEILRLLWKYALSWSSGYFIFQIYTPFMFQFHGPIEAGKVGISISLITSIFNLSNIWLSANNPKINVMVAKKEWGELDQEFKKDLLLSILTYMGIIALLFISILIMQNNWPLYQKLRPRFLGEVPLLTLVIGWFLQIMVNGMALYLRAHKQEPFVVPSVVSGIFIIVSTYLCAKYLTSSYFFIGFLGSYVYGLPWTYSIFKRKKLEWHM